MPAIEQAAMSPNGQRVAMLSHAGVQSVISIATFDQPTVPAVSLGDVDVATLQWLDDQYVLAEVDFWHKFGRRNLPLWRVVAISADGRIASTLLDKDLASANVIRHRVVGIDPGPPARAYVIGRSGRVGAQLMTPMLMSVNPADGVGQIAEEGSARTRAWGFDPKGKARVRLDSNGHGGIVVMYRKSPEADWTAAWTSGSKAEVDGYRGYSATNDALLLTRKSSTGDQLVLKDLNSGSETPLGAQHDAAPWMVSWDAKRRDLAGWGFGAERPQWEWFDSEVGAIHASLARHFKSADVTLVDWSVDRKRFVLTVTAPDMPNAWYLFDSGRRELSPLGDTYPELKGVPLGTTRWMTYKARDGLEISAYVTLPPGAAKPAALPLIVLPHPGPLRRDDYDFDYVAQFLATRGYVVLRPQYRGSANFGEGFAKAGDREWGGAMQTDLLDGIASLAAQGLVDPRRVCIVGKGFGGYLALAGAALHPEAYACASSLAGASNLKVVLAGRAGGAFDELQASLAKIPFRDPIYDAMSPNLHARSVRGPVLLMSIDEDPMSSLEQTKLMREALAEAGRPFEELLLKDTDYYLQSPKARTQMLEALEAFLAKNLPVSRP